MTEINALLSILALLLIGLFIYGPWQSLMTEMARQRLFEIRDDIYDLALEGRMRFDDPTYRDIRQAFNILIRFQHRLTWPVLLLFFIWDRKKRLPRHPMIDLSGVDDALAAQLQGKLRDAALVSTTFMVLRSPVLTALSPLVIVFTVLYAMVMRRRATFTGINNALIQRVEDEVLRHAPQLEA